jgi:hypothetical protein
MAIIIDINKKYTDCILELDAIQEGTNSNVGPTAYCGFVYLLKIKDNLFKIGMSDDIGEKGNRLGFLHLSLLRNGIKDFEVILLIKSNASKQLELRLHDEFNDKKVQGKRDYFFLTDEDISILRTIAETESFRPEIPRAKRQPTASGSIENFLSEIFGKKDELISVARVLAGNPNGFLTISQIQERMQRKYYVDIIEEALKRIDSKHNYLEINNNSFKLNINFWEDFRKRTLIVDQTVDVIVRSETEEDREKLEAAGIAHCPSCGNPTSKSDIFPLSGSERFYCLTEYFRDALMKKRHTVKPDGLHVITIKGLPGLKATGNTEDECRLNLIEELKKWMEKQRIEGSAIPDLR